MDSTYYLPATTYNPNAPFTKRFSSPLDRRQTFNTIIEDSPQISQGFFSPQLAQNVSRAAMISPTYLSPTYSEDFPTPKASLLDPTRAIQMDDIEFSPVESPKWSKEREEFDELYMMTDNESEEEEVPLKCSNSVKKISASSSSSARSSTTRVPSLIIPSPSHWPTIEKLQGSAVSPATYSPLPVSSTPNLLSVLLGRNKQAPATHDAPSLDGSLSSEEMERLSCPSTPDRHAQEEGHGQWAGPIQLDPAAMETLHHLTTEQAPVTADQVIEVPEGEMQQVMGRNRTSVPRLFTANLSASPVAPSDAEDMSALSIPSPGGFFSSLKESARHTWSIPRTREATPSTSIAETFYGVPWRNEPNNIVEQVVEVPASFDTSAEMTPTARDGFMSPVGEVLEIKPSETVYEYNENYAAELAKLSSANLSRTSMWLSAQETWLEGVMTPSTPTHERGNSIDSVISPSKKSVRFVDLIPPKSPSVTSEDEAAKVSTFLEALVYLRESTGKYDAFIHRQTRAEAVHLQRRCMPKTHRRLHLSKFELNSPSKIPSTRPVSTFYTDDPNMHKEQIAKAHKERQALDLIRPAFWTLEASKLLHGGRLITSPAHRVLAHARDNNTTRVLDLGGQGSCDWAWQVALDYPRTTVHTVSTVAEAPVMLEGQEEREMEGPANHRRMQVPNYWTLPFPNGHFDVVSARNMYALLKTSKPSTIPGAATTSNKDEYDLCLKECLRILKPGGYLEFFVMDADILRAGAGGQAQALSVEFGFNLKTRGYDAAATKSFVPRLARAGFRDVKRAWTALPFPQPGAKWNEPLNVGASAPATETTTPSAKPEPVRQSSDSFGSERTLVPSQSQAQQAQKPKRDSLMMDDKADGEEQQQQQQQQQQQNGSTKDARDVAGLVGAWAWERWLVKLQAEMGKDESRLGEGVVQALEEGARDGAAWRCVEGWARKGF
ncbi:uncharacterized protein K452DRAFT_282670 [Aplosporella prunicola CBS 121167]|uniref:Uncharacterized protein n=1 Tax=Aplosporella prunicola CBS 121167 TaxID=1176127 RepID=A0A6A6BTA1_9PEZI|nr:uncharacterized protein K452DRAFT_282670 [Aplosporella prunicola CBS 121167]KAF2146495.1 hypothetical protein K452DRAFT_282670 [Aplosporella prunicola CBS 121167]